MMLTLIGSARPDAAGQPASTTLPVRPCAARRASAGSGRNTGRGPGRETLEDLGVGVACDDDLADRALVEGARESVIDEHDRLWDLPISSTTVPPPAGTRVVCDSAQRLVEQRASW